MKNFRQRVNTPLYVILDFMIDHSGNCGKTFFKKLRASTTVRRMFGTLHMLSCFSHVLLFVTPWTVACKASVHGILQARILE